MPQLFLFCVFFSDLSWISAAVGLIALSGIAVVNGLVLESGIKRQWVENVDCIMAIEQASLARLRPLLMTALIAAIGFLPMALSTDIDAEVQRS